MGTACGGWGKGTRLQARLGLLHMARQRGDGKAGVEGGDLTYDMGSVTVNTGTSDKLHHKVCHSLTRVHTLPIP
jgi:hypothetical protein